MYLLTSVQKITLKYGALIGQKNCESFVKKHENMEKFEKEMVLMGVEPMTKGVTTWQGDLKASKLPLSETRAGVSGLRTRVKIILENLNLKTNQEHARILFFMFDLQIAKFKLKSSFLNEIE